MELKEWREMMGGCKASTKYTGFGYFCNKPVKVNKERTLFILRREEASKSEFGDGVHEYRATAKFDKPQKVSVFLADTLFAVAYGKKPRDYAGYDKYPAGEETIKNLVSLTKG